jgi:hypothetical protein
LHTSLWAAFNTGYPPPPAISSGPSPPPPPPPPPPTTTARGGHGGSDRRAAPAAAAAAAADDDDGWLAAIGLPPAPGPRFMQPTQRQLGPHHVLAPKHSQYFLRHADFRHLHPTLWATPAPPIAPPGARVAALGGRPWNIPSLLFRYLLFTSGSRSRTNFGRNAAGFLVTMAFMARRRPSSFDSVFMQSRQRQLGLHVTDDEKHWQ